VVDNPGDLPDATHDLISHDGPRSPLGGRYSCVAGTAIVKLLNQEHIRAGASYKMDVGEYHETPNNGIVVTVLQKLHESTDFHASTLIERGHTFDQDFDRFQVPPERLWQFVVDALGSAA
jgi:hypothetical protein